MQTTRTIRTILTVILAIMLSPWASFAQPSHLAMPPAFTSEASVDQTLRAYPLGIITKQAAFSHHGEAHRKITLPNGLEGWVYDVGGLSKAVPYVSPAGEKQIARETSIRHEVRSYTLVFDTRGVVIDVLYNEDGGRDGHTALSLQHMKGVARTEDHTHPASH